MGHSVEIISLVKREIIYKKKKKILSNKIRLGVYCVFLFALACFGKIVINSVGLSQKLSTCINPIFSPYVETSNMVFTSLDFNLESKELEFISPVVFENYEIFENEIVFSMLENSVVRASEDGVVIEISQTSDNVKYIKLLHCDGVITIYENIEIAGVNTGEKVVKGDSIATTKSNNLKLSFFKDNSPLLIDSISDNIILCKK